MVRRTLALVLLFTAVLAPSALALIGQDDSWQVQGDVRAMQVVGQTLYIGGAFHRIVPPTGSAVPFDTRTGAPVQGFSRVRGGVDAIVSDGVGGWFVGGAFSSVDGKPIASLVHFRRNLTVADWAVRPPSMVTALRLDRDRLYVGGDGYLIAYDAATGQELSWQARTEGVVTAIATAGDRVLVGGIFAIRSQTVYGLAALDARTAAVLDWNPAQGLGGSTNARALVVIGNTLYVGGSFNGKLSGISRRNLAAIDIHSGAILPWNPDPDGDVTSLIASRGQMYVAGGFETIGGQHRSHVALLDIPTGITERWNPDVDGHVDALVPGNGLLYAVGSFQNVGGEPHRFAAAIDPLNGRPTGWGIQDLLAPPTCAATGRGTLYLGAAWPLGVGSVVRNGTAAIDTRTGEPTSWDPRAGDVDAMLVDGDNVYLGGGFADVGGIPRKALAAVDRVTGRLLPWNPDPNGGVWALTRMNRTLYVGGSFTRIVGRLRGAGAAFSLSNRHLEDWDPRARHSAGLGTLRALVPAGDQIYIGGDFTRVGDLPRANLAAVDAASGAPMPWNPATDRTPGSSGGIYALAKSGQSVFVAGLFDHVNGVARPSLAEVDAVSGELLPLDLNLNDFIFGLLVDDGVLYAGGFVRPLAVDIASRTRLPWGGPSYGRTITFTSGDGLIFIGSAAFDGLTVAPTARPGRASVEVAQATTALAIARPTTGAFRLSFALPAASPTRLAIYDIAGRQVARLADGVIAPGRHEISWDARADGVRPGIYFARLDAGVLHATRKLVVF